MTYNNRTGLISNSTSQTQNMPENFLYVKKTVSKTAFFREGISFLWGIAKNYIMYWGLQVV